jgi:hypothetical protein
VTALNFPHADKTQTRQLVGAAQIADGTGRVLARRDFSEGGGYVLSDITWDTGIGPRNAFPPDYWIPELPASYLRAWEVVNPRESTIINCGVAIL